MIDRNSTLLDITDKYPETIPVFTSNGFPQMADQEKRRTFAGTISLSNALLLKQIDTDAFVHLLEESIDTGRQSSDVTLAPPDTSDPDGALRVVGLLPCPVRLPLLEQWIEFLKRHNESGGRRIKHELKAASMGLEWVQKNIDGVTEAEDLPDLFISAGFEMFFDKERFGRFRRDGVFSDLSGYTDFNSDFKGLDLKDPEGAYSVISVVPAVFLVNMDELGNRAVPATWKDILSPEYEGCVSLPVGDFDLFNSILLNIHKNYGDEGLRALGRCLLESMHPSQMVKSERRKAARPAITIMPYFFTKMVKEGSSMRAVWPSDGAIISPIFMLAKKAQKDSLQPVIDFFASAAAGNILARQGLFPSTRPDVNNGLGEGKKFMWLGWDYINGNDLSTLIHHCEKLFHGASRGPGVSMEEAS